MADNQQPEPPAGDQKLVSAAQSKPRDSKIQSRLLPETEGLQRRAYQILSRAIVADSNQRLVEIGINILSQLRKEWKISEQNHMSIEDRIVKARLSYCQNRGNESADDELTLRELHEEAYFSLLYAFSDDPTPISTPMIKIITDLKKEWNISNFYHSLCESGIETELRLRRKATRRKRAGETILNETSNLRQKKHVSVTKQISGKMGLSDGMGHVIPEEKTSIFSICSTQLYTMATKRSVGTLKEADLKGNSVFVSVRWDDRITVSHRIRDAAPTIEYLMGNGSRVVLCNHLDRPKGVIPEYSSKPRVAELLGIVLGVKVVIANGSIGEEVQKLVAGLPEGGALLLENVRFYKDEEKNDREFAKKLAALVKDAFGTAHRLHASTDYLVRAVANPKKPLAAIVGGSKVSTKIESVLSTVDILLLGGGMIYTFYKALGHAVGSSLLEEDKLDLARSLIEKAKANGVSLLLPTDVVIADKFATDANAKIVPATAIPDGRMGLDIGPDSIKTFSEALDASKTIIWNGPMGVFKFDTFAAGTEAVAKQLAELSGKGVTTIIGGDDSVAAVEKDGLADKMSHISTGGGASLEFLVGKPLPGALALDDA